MGQFSVEIPPKPGQFLMKLNTPSRAPRRAVGLESGLLMRCSDLFGRTMLGIRLEAHSPPTRRRSVSEVV
jgi:hypothetical protein